MDTDPHRAIIALEAFRRTHQKTLGYPYLVSWGKDNKIIKDLAAIYDLKTLNKLIELFFRKLKTDEFLRKTGASMGVFRTQVPKLLLEVMEQNDKLDSGTLSTGSLETAE